MDILGAMESFIAAAQAGSLSGAARQRRVTQPAISQHITALENEFDACLLLRNRSGVRMTQAGEVVYRYAVAMLGDRGKLKRELHSLSQAKGGQITIAAEHAFSHDLMGQVLADLADLRPDIDFTVQEDDPTKNLDTGGIDVALRSGPVGNAAGIIRKVGTMSIVLVATPTYLTAIGRPKTPSDLIALDYIQYRASDDQIATVLERGMETIQAPIKVGLTAQAPYLVFQALNGNMGFAKMPEFLAADAIKNHQLEVVLPSWKCPEKDLFLVFPPGQEPAPQIITVLHALIKRLKAARGINLTASAEQLHPGG